ncbi:MAG: MGDG synthase family glycosyltransferase [Gaiellaceae bacterium]
MTRVLVYTAAVGEGHEVPARAIERGILAREPTAEVHLVDALDVLGRTVHRVAEDDLRRPFGGGGGSRLFDLEYTLFARTGPLRALGQAALHRVSGGRLARDLERRAPDVVVSTYPVLTNVLGHLRRTRRLGIPTVSAVTDLSSLWYWASRGIDLHLLTHPESVEEVRRIAGPGRIVAVRGLHDERFLEPHDQAEARAALGVEAPLVIVSGGGWGVGDVEGAARIAVEQANVVVLAGRNERLLGLQGLQVLPFVDDPAAVLAAADVLVHSTAGLTILEALLLGVRPISYGWSVAHIRENNKAFRRTGLARVAVNEEELRAALAAALAEPRRPQAPRHAALPHAADLILELAERA